MPDDPIRARLRDPVYARAFDSWLSTLIEHAAPGRRAPSVRRRRIVTLPPDGAVRTASQR